MTAEYDADYFLAARREIPSSVLADTRRSSPAFRSPRTERRFFPLRTTARSEPGRSSATDWKRVASFSAAACFSPDSMSIPREPTSSSAGNKGQVLVVPIAGGPPQELIGFSERTLVETVRLFARWKACGGGAEHWPFRGESDPNLESQDRSSSIVGPATRRGRRNSREEFWDLAFLDDNKILATVDRGLVLLDLRDGAARIMTPRPNGRLAIGRTGRFGFGTHGGRGYGELLRFELTGSAAGGLTTYGASYPVAVNSTETAVATAGDGGIVRIGPTSGGEPYLFFGHTGFDPRSRVLPGRTMARVRGRRPYHPPLAGARCHQSCRRTSEATRSSSRRFDPGPTFALCQRRTRLQAGSSRPAVPWMGEVTRVITAVR